MSNKKNKIKVLVLKASGERYFQCIDNTLKAMQELVGGYIETVTTDYGVFVLNEEGKLNGLEFNSVASIMLSALGGLRKGDMVMGDVLVCGADGEDFSDIPDKLASYFMRLEVKGEQNGYEN